ncbi:dihydrofolate reductase family protein [Yinghuangia soli]|uniref:Dihydrofolate reductase family protein n=1 Tax=Yinghuangia soli TaxID=2908204 RepID=A0AA41TZU8_9ACTN|nr:dihydrofolate reductase family protein [Yinghuangia soli]MCF2527881.1 dihydrofolate reductase family protein [Yinghuangia soli]
MRKLTYYISHSIDGFIAAPDGDFNFLMGFDEMFAWIVENSPETLPTPVHAAIGSDPTPKKYDTVIMGRATYDPGYNVGLFSPYAHLRQYVVTSSLKETPAADVTLVGSDPLATVRALKAEDGDMGIWLAGGGTLASALYDEIDELVFKTYPVLAGAGIPLFQGPFNPRRFDLVETRQFAEGSSVSHYVKTT